MIFCKKCGEQISETFNGGGCKPNQCRWEVNEDLPNRDIPIDSIICPYCDCIEYIPIFNYSVDTNNSITWKCSHCSNTLYYEG